MKHMKTVLILEHTEEVFDKLSCDLCGKESRWDENWSHTDHERILTTVQLEEEESLPNGGHATLTQYHICPECFKTRLARWIEQHRQQPATVTQSVW